MNANRLAVLKQVMPRWEIDIEAGTVKTRKGLVKTVDAYGYLRVQTGLNNKKYSFGVHEVIAVAGGLDITDKEVNHIDGDKLNNSINNLEPVTRSENMQHAYANGLHSLALLNSVQVADIKKNLKNYTRGMVKELADKYGVDIRVVSDIKTGKNWSHINI